MSTHKSFDKICCVVLALTLILVLLFVNGEKLGIQKVSTVPGYEKTLFDTSRVHTIDIIMDNWDEFTANAKSEEYYTCTVVIDNEVYKNVAIRGKGNTSLSQVNNDRYSYKIEFDHYDSTNTYYGLDKLCLNNIIQDNTYMKDYLTYQMMNEMGVAAPLCSYAYITVNGEDWGLYLAVEGLEEAFLQRNYGKDYGELYKPDSMNMGGGRGNGEKFDIDEFFNDFESESADNNSSQSDNQVQNNNTIPQNSSGNQEANTNNQMPGGMGGQRPNENGGMFGGQMPGGQMPGNMQGGMQSGSNPPELPNGETMTDPIAGSTQGEMAPNSGESTNDSANDTNDQVQQNGTVPEMGGQRPDGNMQGGDKGEMRNGSDDVLLKYIDDEIESYANIFDSAKTDITDSDKTRLINALKKLSNGEDLENVVDIDAVIRYFVVHNFVLNFDSYTGSMIHNYYLYEKDGQMQMLPWDYNLAFGGFQSMGGATSLVNYPIDSPVSGGNAEDRPMIAWIFENEEYTELYHKYFSEFIATYFDSGYFSEMIDNVNTMISPYVEKDPTKFCTYEEFEKGIATLKEFCLLRAESISGQLDGTIGSTSDTQVSDTLIDASELNISSMGTMGDMGGKGGMNFSGSNMQKPQSNSDDSSNNDSSTEKSSGESITAENNSGNSRPQMPDDFGNGAEPEGNNGKNNNMQENPNGQMQNLDGNVPDRGQSQTQPQNMISVSSLVVLGVSVFVLGLSIVFALKYKRRK